MQDYLVPANTKSGSLIFSIFTKFDLILFGSGITISIILLLITSSMSVVASLLAIAPGGISAFLVLPIPHYHNVLTIITSMYSFLTGRRVYYWKGWCIHDGEK